MTSPIHGKKAYAFITLGNNTNLMSFVTEYAINTTPQDVARAKVLGTDAVPGVKSSSVTARARLSLYLSEDEPEWDRALGNFSSNTNQIDVNYIEAIAQLKLEQAWHVMGELNVILVALRDNLKVADAQSLTSLRALAGKIYQLQEAAVVGMEEIARVGNFVEVRLEVETGAFRKITNKVVITPSS